jgi:D-psicose/D-tagatose/L-ribulose 3-epimerase
MVMPRIAMNMLLWSTDVTDSRFDPVIAILAEAGYDGIEVPIFALTPEPYARLGERLRALGLRAVALTARSPAANPISADPDVRAAGVRENLAALECAAALGAEVLCGPLHQAPVALTGAPPTEEERVWAVELLHAMAGVAEDCGVMVAIESLNHFEHHLANTTEQTAQLVRRVDRPAVRMMYDSFHAHIEEKNVADAIRACADVLVYLHVSENDRSIPGTGQVDWATTFATLREVGYDGWLTVEALGTADPELAAQMRLWRTSITDEEQVAREAIGFVRDAWERAA